MENAMSSHHPPAPSASPCARRSSDVRRQSRGRRCRRRCGNGRSMILVAATAAAAVYSLVAMRRRAGAPGGLHMHPLGAVVVVVAAAVAENKAVDVFEGEVVVDGNVHDSNMGGKRSIVRAHRSLPRRMLEVQGEGGDEAVKSAGVVESRKKSSRRRMTRTKGSDRRRTFRRRMRNNEEEEEEDAGGVVSILRLSLPSVGQYAATAAASGARSKDEKRRDEILVQQQQVLSKLRSSISASRPRPPKRSLTSVDKAGGLRGNRPAQTDASSAGKDADDEATFEVIGTTQYVLNAIILRTSSRSDAALLRAVVRDDDELKSSITRLTDGGSYDLELAETVPYVWGEYDDKEEADDHDIGNSSSSSSPPILDGRPEWLDGTGVTVAVLDSGIDYTHSSLGGKGTVASYLSAYSDPTSTPSSDVFPNSKVRGGYDFAGGDFVGDYGMDGDPIDFDGHGTAVADIIAGTGEGASGVAPGASLLAVKVCLAGNESGCPGHALLLGLEYAVAHGADIINFSLGSPYSQPFDDDLSQAIDAASSLGVLSVASGGNCGDKPFCVSSPGSAPSALAVAQTTTPRGNGPLAVLKVMTTEDDGGSDGGGNTTAAAAAVVVVANVASFPWTALPLTTGSEDGASLPSFDPPVGGDLVYGHGENVLGCDPFPPNSLSGKVVMIDRGLCYFSVKIANVEAAGGVAAIVANNVPGLPFGGANGNQTYVPSIPAYMVGLDDAIAIKEALEESSEARALGAELMPPPPRDGKGVRGAGFAGWTVASTARGPDMSYHKIKPEIGAPGESMAAEVGTGNQTKKFGGTSGASPVVAGAAALLKQWCPSCGPLAIKALLMNSAYRGVRSDTNGGPAEITRIGAGELRIGRALASTMYAYQVEDGQPSLGLGLIDVDADKVIVRTVKVVNLLKDREQLLSFEASFRLEEKATSGAVEISMTVNGNPSKSVLLAPCGDALVSIVFSLRSSAMPLNGMNSGGRGEDPSALGHNEFDGYVTFVPVASATTAAGQAASLPWHMIARRASRAEPDRTSLLDPSADAPDTIHLSNYGAATATVDAYDLVAVSDEKERGRRGEESPVPDIRAVGVRTERVSEEICGSTIAMEFAVSFWNRMTIAGASTVYIGLDPDWDETKDFYIFNSGVAGEASVYNESTDEVTAAFFVEHGTNSKTMRLRVCGEMIGLDLADVEMSDPKPIGVTVSVQDALFGGPGDRTAAFEIIPFGERFTLGNIENRIDRTSFESTYDVESGKVGTLPIYDMGPQPYTNPSSLGLMLVTDDSRDDNNNGAATEDSEVYLLLAHGAVGPVPLPLADAVEVVPLALSDSTLTCNSLPTQDPTPSPTFTLQPTVSFASILEPTASPRTTILSTAAPTTDRTLLNKRSAQVLQESPCIEDTTAIFDAESALLDPTFAKRTYVLCPNTTYNIGIWDRDNEKYNGGMAALEIFNRNIEILCGWDGKSGNNCVLDGGEFHAYIFDYGIPLSNVLVSGVTFQGATNLNVYANARTDATGVVFRDCIFRENDNVALVYASNPKGSGGTFALDRCLFESNSLMVEGMATRDTAPLALVYNEGDAQNMRITGSKFLNNDVPVPVNVALPTVIVGNLNGGDLELAENCFVDNAAATALVLSGWDGSNTDDGMAESNYASGSVWHGSPNDFCDGLVDLDTDRCMTFQAPSCGATFRLRRLSDKIDTLL